MASLGTCLAFHCSANGGCLSETSYKCQNKPQRHSSEMEFIKTWLYVHRVHRIRRQDQKTGSEDRTVWPVTSWRWRGSKQNNSKLLRASKSRRRYLKDKWGAICCCCCNDWVRFLQNGGFLNLVIILILFYPLLHFPFSLNFICIYFYLSLSIYVYSTTV